MSRLSLALILAASLLPATAKACLNDREVERTEREFKSSYIEKQAPAMPTYPEATPKNNLPTYGGAAGMVFLLGGFVLALRRVK